MRKAIWRLPTCPGAAGAPGFGRLPGGLARGLFLAVQSPLPHLLLPETGNSAEDPETGGRDAVAAAQPAATAPVRALCPHGEMGRLRMPVAEDFPSSPSSPWHARGAWSPTQTKAGTCVRVAGVSYRWASNGGERAGPGHGPAQEGQKGSMTRRSHAKAVPACDPVLAP